MRGVAKNRAHACCLLLVPLSLSMYSSSHVFIMRSVGVITSISRLFAVTRPPPAAAEGDVISAAGRGDGAGVLDDAPRAALRLADIVRDCGCPQRCSEATDVNEASARSQERRANKTK